MNRIENAIRLYLKKYPPALEIYDDLKELGNIYLIGGVLREYRDNNTINKLRDIDIVIDITSEEKWLYFLKKYNPTRNRFQGYKMICEKFVFDVWILQETWAYRQKLIVCGNDEYVKKLCRTVFLNVDAIVYDVKRNIWYDDIYKSAMESRVLDVVLPDNPQIRLNILRALVLGKRYEMRMSSRLWEIIDFEVQKDRDIVDDLMKIQSERYKEVLLSRHEIIKILDKNSSI